MGEVRASSELCYVFMDSRQQHQQHQQTIKARPDQVSRTWVCARRGWLACSKKRDVELRHAKDSHQRLDRGSDTASFAAAPHSQKAWSRGTPNNVQRFDSYDAEQQLFACSILARRLFMLFPPPLHNYPVAGRPSPTNAQRAAPLHALLWPCRKLSTFLVPDDPPLLSSPNHNPHGPSFGAQPSCGAVYP